MWRQRKLRLYCLSFWCLTVLAYAACEQHIPNHQQTFRIESYVRSGPDTRPRGYAANGYDQGLSWPGIQNGRSQQPAHHSSSRPQVPDAAATAAAGQTIAGSKRAGSIALRQVLAAGEGSSEPKLPPVDVVYGWVNGSDPAFVKRYKQYIGEEPSCKRVQNNNEILMALQAICKHQPWVNHVYIVVDQQSFSLDFLKPACRQKVSFVDFTEFIPAEYLPTFNSHTFETFLYRIPGLSNHFVYLNDDMIMSRPISPASLFDRDSNGFRFRTVMKSHAPGDPTNPKNGWLWPRVNGRQLFKSAFGGSDPRGYDAHSAYFLSREAMQKTWGLFGKQLDAALRHNKKRKYASLAYGGDVHFTSLSQQVGVQLTLLIPGNPILIDFVQHDSSHSLARYVSSMFYGRAHVVCLQDLISMTDARLNLLCNLVSDLWCMSGVGDSEQQKQCKLLVSMCSHRPPCRPS